MNLSLRAVRYFVTTAEAGSISDAAKMLNISNSAIAAAIDSIEAEFRVQLILRQKSKGIELTPSGRMVLVQAKHFLEEYENFLSEGRALTTALYGTLNIGYFAPIAPSFIPQIIAPIMTENNNVYLRLNECNNDQAQDGLRNGEYDVSIFMDYAVHPDIQFKPLLEIPPYLLVSAGHRFARQASVSFAELAGENLLLLNLPTTLDYYTSMLKSCGSRPNIIAETNSVEMIRSMVSAGLGCSILNMRPNSDRTYFGQRVACVPLSDKPERSINVVLGFMPGRNRRIVHAFEEACTMFFASARAEAHRVRPSEIEGESRACSSARRA